MRLIIHPHEVDLMKARVPFVILYDLNQIIEGESAVTETGRKIIGRAEDEAYCLTIPGSLAVWIPYDVIARGYAETRKWFDGVGVQLAP